MRPDEIDAAARRLRQTTGQHERYVNLPPILAHVNAELRIDPRMPSSTVVDGIFQRQLDGLCIRGRLRYYIYVNGRITAPTRRRFTIAHEIGHIVLHDESCSLFSQEPHLQDRPEIEANLFANHLLIPRDRLCEDLAAGMSVCQLSSLYSVSPQAMERAVQGDGER